MMRTGAGSPGIVGTSVSYHSPAVRTLYLCTSQAAETAVFHANHGRRGKLGGDKDHASSRRFLETAASSGVLARSRSSSLQPDLYLLRLLPQACHRDGSRSAN